MPTSSFSRSRVVGIAMSVMVMLSGCCSTCGRVHFNKCADIPKGAIPQPTGTYACQWQRAQIDRGRLDNFVVHENEWHRGGDKLGPAGAKHVEQLAGELVDPNARVIIESHYDTDENEVDEELNEVRREAVVKALAAKGIANADSVVVVGYSNAEGLYGMESVLIGGRRLQGGRIGGGGGGGFGGGGFGGGGFGGGGLGGGGFGGGGGLGGMYGGGFQ